MIEEPSGGVTAHSLTLHSSIRVVSGLIGQELTGYPGLALLSASSQVVCLQERARLIWPGGRPPVPASTTMGSCSRGPLPGLGSG